ncbi:MAG: hypothetical protein WCI97_07335, partial [Bacteroidota bacterium]
MKFFFSIFFLSAVTLGLSGSRNQNYVPVAARVSYYPSSKPCVRWWWFATEIKKSDIKYQLNWVKQ